MKIDLSTIMEMIEQEDKNPSETSTSTEKQKETALDLRGLFSLFEELEKNPIDIKEATGEQRSKLLKLLVPEIKIPEKGVPADTSVIDAYMKKTAGKSPLEKLQRLNDLAKNADQSYSKTGNNIALLIERISILNYMRTMFNEFQASPLGFVNESFIAAMFGGSKVQVHKNITSNEVERDEEAESYHKTVVDLVANGEMYSLKTLSKKSQVGGSCDYLARTLKNGGGKVTYLVCMKPKQQDINSITIYEVVIDQSKLDQIKIYPKNKNYQQTFFHKVLRKNVEIAHMGDYLQIWNQKEQLVNIMKNQAVKNEDLANNINLKIPAYRFAIPASLYTSGRSVTINFMVEENMNMLEELVGETLEEVIKIHDKLEMLVSSLQKYFVTTNKQKRMEVGKNMRQAAKDIQSPTEQITKQD